MPTYKQTPFNLWHVAQDHLRAARSVSEAARGGSPYPALLLICVALHLTLNAFLRARGVASLEIQAKTGTDLVRALDHAKRLGLKDLVSLSAAEELAVVALNNFYNARELDHLPHPKVKFPDVDGSAELAERLHSLMAPNCLSAPRNEA